MDNGKMQENMHKGLLFLISKEGGDREEIRHRHLITMLGMASEILVKAVSLHLQSMLEILIHAT